MGQIFNRIKSISTSYINDKADDLSYIFDEEDDELKRIIDKLDSKAFAKEDVRKSKILSHYEVLGVKQASTKEEVYSAYKTLLKQNHPDKVANLSKEIQEIAKTKTIEINQAFNKIKEERKW